MRTGGMESVDSPVGSRLVLVGPADRIFGPGAADVSTRYPEWSCVQRETYLSGIAEVARRGAEAVVAFVDGPLERINPAVEGLREAAGEDARIVLCCPPEWEPFARGATEGGANEYLVAPVGAAELDRAIGYARPAAEVGAPGRDFAPTASLVELEQLGSAIAALDDPPKALLSRLAALLRLAMNASGASVVVEGAMARSGVEVGGPALSAAVRGRRGEVLGQLNLASRADGAYSPGDALKLSRYAEVFGRILSAAIQHRRWRRLAMTDECRGLLNRRGLHERLTQILRQASAERLQVTMLLFDIDDFKTYNDTFGHDAGDEIIRSIGTLFRKHSREQDVVTRYGGDEFAVVFWDPAGPRAAGSKHPQEALALLDRFKEALQSLRLPGLAGVGPGKVTISGGLATFPWDATTMEELISRADEALLLAKRAGKNRVFVVGEA